MASRRAAADHQCDDRIGCRREHELADRDARHVAQEIDRISDGLGGGPRAATRSSPLVRLAARSGFADGLHCDRRGLVRSLGGEP
jgi:hypothetical protein